MVPLLINHKNYMVPLLINHKNYMVPLLINYEKWYCVATAKKYLAMLLFVGEA